MALWCGVLIGLTTACGEGNRFGNNDDSINQDAGSGGDADRDADAGEDECEEGFFEDDGECIECIDDDDCHEGYCHDERVCVEYCCDWTHYRIDDEPIGSFSPGFDDSGQWSMSFTPPGAGSTIPGLLYFLRWDDSASGDPWTIEVVDNVPDPGWQMLANATTPRLIQITSATELWLYHRVDDSWNQTEVFDFAHEHFLGAIGRTGGDDVHHAVGIFVDETDPVYVRLGETIVDEVIERQFNDYEASNDDWRNQGLLVGEEGKPIFYNIISQRVIEDLHPKTIRHLGMWKRSGDGQWEEKPLDESMFITNSWAMAAGPQGQIWLAVYDKSKDATNLHEFRDGQWRDNTVVDDVGGARLQLAIDERNEPHLAYRAPFDDFFTTDPRVVIYAGRDDEGWSEQIVDIVEVQTSTSRGGVRLHLDPTTQKPHLWLHTEDMLHYYRPE